jgi:7-cyano-7-deazaguanine synthase
MKKVLVLLSGGLDSTTALYWAIYKRYEVSAIGINYGSKHNSREIQSAKHIACFNDIDYRVFNLKSIFKNFNSSLLDRHMNIPEGHYSHKTMRSTVVPFRNGIMLAIAAGFAESNKIDKIILASHLGDRSVYPDCRQEFNKAMAEAIEFGTYKKIKFVAPFENMTKIGIVQKGVRKYKVPYEKTYSCYNGKERPCLKCGTCIERTEAFYMNGFKDPLLSEIEWKKAVDYLKKASDAKVFK